MGGATFPSGVVEIGVLYKSLLRVSWGIGFVSGSDLQCGWGARLKSLLLRLCFGIRAIV